MTTATETRDFTVEGMTCSHCMLSVGEQVSEVMSATYLVWAAAVGAAGCGRCEPAV